MFAQPGKATILLPGKMKRAMKDNFEWATESSFLFIIRVVFGKVFVDASNGNFV